MNMIFDNLNGNIDLSIFEKSNTDPKTRPHCHYINTGGVGPEHHEYIDLGLPSGTLWATENIKDASGNELYFAWGETQGYTAAQIGNEEGKRAFSWDNYKFGSVSTLTKYNGIDGITVLEPGDDAATANWSKEWKMPTEEQFQELIANTTHEFTEIDGIPGAKFTSKVEGHTDKFLFFPAVGYALDGEVLYVGGSSYCWSASLGGGNVGGARRFLSSGDYDIYRMVSSFRYFGNSVRPVRA